MANAMLQQDDLQKVSTDTDWTPYSKPNNATTISNLTGQLQQEKRQDIESSQLSPSLLRNLQHPAPGHTGINTMYHPNAITNNMSKQGRRLSPSSASVATLPHRKSVDFATLPPPTPKRMRHMLLSSSIQSSHAPKWTAQHVVDGTICFPFPHLFRFFYSIY
jgi:hypothetical protein